VYFYSGSKNLGQTIWGSNWGSIWGSIWGSNFGRQLGAAIWGSMVGQQFGAAIGGSSLGQLFGDSLAVSVVMRAVPPHKPHIARRNFSRPAQANIMLFIYFSAAFGV